MRVQTIPGNGSQYSLKVWEDGKEEPLDWQMAGLELESDLANGSFLLIAHHVDATFGNVNFVEQKEDGGGSGSSGCFIATVAE